MEPKRIKSALISVFYKDGLEDIVKALDAHGVTIYSTGGTQKFIQGLGVEPVAVESLTGYPSILGGRVKTLHPKVFGGILSRRDMFSDGEQLPVFKESCRHGEVLRYGENPHQKGVFYGDLEGCFDKLNGKEISYNNLGDIDAACALIDDFEGQTAFAILKHNNACGMAVRPTLLEAWKDALAGDPVSAFGGVLICNQKVTKEVADEMHKIFFEVCIAPDYDDDALAVLKGKKNRIILRRKAFKMADPMFRSVLNGVLVQDRDTVVPVAKDMDKSVTSTKITKQQAEDLAFATILVKHTKSNAIVLAKGKQLYASGTGQTSRVDALRQAIAKAKSFGFDLNGAVMASDAFFPFPDCVEIAHEAGIAAVAHPGGSIHDQDSIDYCEKNHMGMAITGKRHFKH